MGYFKGFILVGAVLTLLALTASSASATVLCKSTTTPCQSAYGIGTKLDASLSGSFQLESKGETLATCTGSTIKGSTTTAGGELEAVTAPIESLTWSGCSQTTTTLKAGELAISHNTGTDDGTVEFKGTEVTLFILSFTCTYRPATGTLKGGESPSIEINAVATKTAGSYLCPTEAKWIAKYEVTEPKPIYVEPDRRGAVLCKSTTTPCQSAYGIGTKIDASLSGSLQLESKGETFATCTGGTIKGSTATAGGELEAVTAPVESLTWSGCNSTTHTLKAGELAISHNTGTDDGTVEFKGTEVTFLMNGVSCTYRPGTGTLKGGESPSLEINALATKVAGGFLCPTEMKWIAKYEVTEPKPIYVEPDRRGAVLCKSTTTPCQSAYGIGTKLDASLSGSFQLESKGETLATCTGSTIKGSTTTAGGELEAVTAPIESLTWSGCSQTTTTLKAGELAISHNTGTDDGTVEFKGTEVTLFILSFTCTYRPATGTLKGGESPSIEINAVATKTAGSYLCPTEPKWIAKYEVTEPKPIYVEPS